MKNKIQWFSIDLFPYRYGFCPSKTAWECHAKNSDYPLEDAAGAVAECDNGSIMVLCDALDLESINGMSTVAHESVHIWQNMAESLGIEEHGEVEAYCIQRILDDMLTVALKYKKKEMK